MSSASVCSVPSHASVGHSSSNGSRRSKSNAYRTVSRTSHIEENLFGQPNHVKQRKAALECQGKCKDDDIVTYGGIRRELSPERIVKQKEEAVRVITKDLVRNLKVPREDPSLKSVIIGFGDYSRLKGRSRVMSTEERAQYEEDVKNQKDMELKASQERRQEMKKMDILRKKNDKMSDLEEEAYRKAQSLLRKAMLQREEQEDEIKKLNEMISNAKVQAIRDAQILEKEIIKRENKEEDERLDKMMEIDRVNAIIIQDEIEKLRKEEELIAASAIIRQIEENEQERLIELEKKDQENKVARQRIAILMEEEIQKRQKIRERQQLLRDELNKANIGMLERKSKEKELEKLLDLRVLEIQKEKAEREAELEAESQKIRADKEKEVARLRALQERARDEQAERDELRARRAMEDAEREWRRKELEEQRKKKDVEDELKQARSEQAEMKEHFLAIQAARDRAEFERTLRVQKELMEKERQIEDIEKEKRSNYSKDLRNQIRKNEETKIEERNTFFREGEKLEEEAKLRRIRLEEAKNRKLVELRDAGIPDKFLKQIERKVQHSQKMEVI